MTRRPHLNGRRGIFLILFALSYTCVGVSYTCLPAPPGRTHSLTWLLHWVPSNVIGDLWFSAALIALISAFLPLPDDRWGFVALFAVTALMGVVYAVSWAVGDAPSGLVSMVLLETIGSAILVVSGMTNPVLKAKP